MAGRPARIWQIAATFVAALAGTAIVAEATLRLFGGERFRYRADPEIEYLPAPDQAVVQGGLDMRTNQWGMRSDAVAETRPADAFRVMVIGDSIVFGHTNISHDDLATTRLSRVRMDDGRRIEALNVSATSWGPGNMLAWLDRFGMLEADAIVLVLSTHDLGDDRSFKPPDRNVYPQAAPLSLLADGLWRRLTPDPAASAPDDPRSEGDAMAALPGLFQRAADAPTGGCLIVHPTAAEWKAKVPTAEEQRLETTALGAGLDVFYGRDFISDASDYSDGIHLSPAGQEDLMHAIAACPALPRLALPTR
jgi:hypothetical protein